MQIIETVIRSIGDLSREVRALPPTRQNWLFRGQADADWRLEPSVHRGYSPQQERYLTNEFRVRASGRHSACPTNTDFPGWLALMQHYGLPTRLLDWSYSPLVAAFFAVHPDYAKSDLHTGRNACIWALDPACLNESQGFEPLIFPLDAVSYEPLIIPAFKNRHEPNAVGVAMALEHDARIQLQQGAFTIHSIRTPINLLPNAHAYLSKFVIRNEDICGFFEELTMLGIRKYTLFPDLTALTSELKAIHLPT
ncbi:FRG domain-containing protein [Oxalobacteraceae bacterium R-40]|uniref:FRG domain-containing protein n=1 Tax=Keguizhuia sedimenti TaxID=3064264 RepID=A0ABU1BSM6_9BURK|nr:FRG domain-containing protein [Oxalobacteraceae bacterium R-40]